MHFQFNPPSITSIRARFVTEKLRSYPHNLGSLNIFVTGRTGSGKTTLGNQLIGIDYFTSTGHQDCTQEINLIDFPIGLRYIDLPGVCSDDKLENYNRVALQLEQIEDFPKIDHLTIAKYCNGDIPQQQHFNLSDFKQFQLKPDIIFYLIAPDKQFTRADRAYLRALLKHYTQVIYVFNMFVNKQNEKVILATDENIIDAIMKVIEVHTSVLGNTHQPIIAGCNCWTGEGISELVMVTHQMLGEERGELFEELIQYQQQHTPIEYMRQVKEELLKMFAYAACQKPDGTYSCEQSLHKISYTLWNFLYDIRSKSERTSYHIGEKIKDLANQVFSASSTLSENDNTSLEREIAYILAGLAFIDRGIEVLNEEISSQIGEYHHKAIELRDQQIQCIQSELQSCVENIKILEQEKNDCIDRYKELVEKIKTLEEKIHSRGEKYQSLMNEVNSDRYKLIDRRQKIDSRIESYNVRLKSFYSTVQEINSGWGRPTQETRNSLSAERDYLNRERNSIESEESSLKKAIASFESKDESLKTEGDLLQKKIAKREKRMKKLSKERTYYQKKMKQLSEELKMYEEKVQFNNEVIQYFENEFVSIGEKIHTRIQEINSRIENIREKLANPPAIETTSLEREIDVFQKEINFCIDEMYLFLNELSFFQKDIENCMAKMILNKIAGEVIRKCSQHHFDETGEFAYRNTIYKNFSEQGITMLLTIIHLSINDGNIMELETAYRSLYESITKRFHGVKDFSSYKTEEDILKLLQTKTDVLFDRSFNETIAKVAL